MFNFDTLKGRLKPQNDVITNQNLGVLAFVRSYISCDHERFKIKIGEKMKHPTV